MFRFFVNEKKENYFPLSPPILKHIKIARIRNENFLINYKGQFYLCKLENKKAKIIKQLNIDNEIKGKIIIGCPLIKFKRFEWMIQKLTELGVKLIIPVISQNTNSKFKNLGEEIFTKKLTKWQNIIHNAAEQSFRNIIPKISKPLNFQNVIEKYSNLKNKIIAHEKSNNLISNLISTDVIIMIGPEGGFSNEEIKVAKNSGFEVVSLGKRILRSETAAIFLTSKLQLN